MGDGTHRSVSARGLSIGLGLLLAMSSAIVTSAIADAQEVDLSVTGVEVTQAIQTSTNSVQLVAQRATAVRATIGVSGSAAPVSGVTGRLHVFVGGVEITPAAGVAPINAPFTAPLSPNRANDNDTLNFELLAPSGITASTNVDFVVDVTPVEGETNTSNNSGSANDRVVVNRSNPSLFFTRIDWTPSGLGLPALADVGAGRGDAFVRGIFPVADGAAGLYQQGLFPTLTYTQDANSNGSLEESPEGNNLISLLASCRQLIVDGGIGAASNTFLYGWIAGNPIDGNGLGQTPGFIAYGNTQASRFQRTYAHELAHNFGLLHPDESGNPATLDEVGWDTGARLVNNPSGNNTTTRAKPTTLFDIMRGGQVTNSAWINTISYDLLFTNPTFSSGGSGDVKLAEDVLVVQGIFDPSGRRLVRLEPAFRFPWLAEPTPGRQRGRFQVVVRTEEGEVLRRSFTAGVRDDSRKETRTFGFFEVMIPAEGEVQSLTLIDRRRERSLAKLARSEGVPEIVIVSPEPEAKLDERTRVAWRVADPDTDLSRLRYQVAYSPDGGLTFVPIGVDLKRTGFSFDSSQIQASEGSGLIRVFVSDGLNTAFADVEGLSTSSADFPPP